MNGINIRLGIVMCYILLLSSVPSWAQRKYTTSVITANHKTYQTKVTKIGGSDQVAVFASDNEILKKTMSSPYMRNYSPLELGTTVDFSIVKRIIVEVIGADNIQRMAGTSSNNLSIFMTFSTQGDYLGGVFYTNSITRITPEMFVELDTRFKRELHASFSEKIPRGLTKPFYKTFNFINYNQQIYFDQL